MSYEQPVFGRAAVSSSQPLATAAGVQLLSQGANAAEASVAMGAVLAVIEPTSNGLGGDIVSMYHNPSNNTTRCILGIGKSPALLTPELFQSQTRVGSDGHRRVLLASPHTITVPGIVDGWCEILQRFGSGCMTWEQIFEPAIRAAELGFPVAPFTAYCWMREAPSMKRRCASHPLLVRDDGAEGGLRAPKAGEIFRNKALAEVLRGIVKYKREDFYSGKVAQAIVKAVQEYGGVLTMDDMEGHRTEVCDPISAKYGEYEVYERPSPTQGIVTLQVLRILERIGCKIDRECSESVHVMVEAIRLAFADAAAKYVGDGARDKDWRSRLSDEHIDKLCARICQERKNEVTYESVLPSGGTTQFCVIDKDGNAMSSAQSNCVGLKRVFQHRTDSPCKTVDSTSVAMSAVRIMLVVGKGVTIQSSPRWK